MKVRLTTAASADLRAISDYLLSVSPLANARFEARLAEILVNIRDYPLTGRNTDRAQIKITNTHPYPCLIFYRLTSSEVLVLRIRHGAHNPRSMPAQPR